MQTNLETLGQLERRLYVAVPARRPSKARSRSASRAWRRPSRWPGFRPGKVPMKMVAQQYGPQVRSEVIGDAVQSSLRRRHARAAPARRRLPAHRAEGRRRADGQLEFSAMFEVYPEIKIGDLSDASRSSARLPRWPPPTSTSTIDVLRKQRVRYEPVDARGCQAGDRVIVDFTGTHRRRRVPGRSGQGLPDRPRRGPDAARIRGRADRAVGRRVQDLSADLSRGLSRQGRGGQDRRSSTLTVKSVDGGSLPPVDAEFARPSAWRAAASTSCGRRSGQPARSSSSARSRPRSRSRRSRRCARRPSSRCRSR